MKLEPFPVEGRKEQRWFSSLPPETPEPFSFTSLWLGGNWEARPLESGEHGLNPLGHTAQQEPWEEGSGAKDQAVAANRDQMQGLGCIFHSLLPNSRVHLLPSLTHLKLSKCKILIFYQKKLEPVFRALAPWIPALEQFCSQKDRPSPGSPFLPPPIPPPHAHLVHGSPDPPPRLQPGGAPMLCHRYTRLLSYFPWAWLF